MVAWRQVLPFLSGNSFRQAHCKFSPLTEALTSLIQVLPRSTSMVRYFLFIHSIFHIQLAAAGSPELVELVNIQSSLDENQFVDSFARYAGSIERTAANHGSDTEANCIDDTSSSTSTAGSPSEPEITCFK